MTWLKTTATGVIVTVRAVPRASRNEIAGIVGNALKIRIQAPPLEGKANASLTKLLARTLDIPPRRITLIAGETSRDKRIEIRGMKADEVARRLTPDSQCP